MSYKIAIASSDGKQIDQTFGQAKSFAIYEVTGDKCSKIDERVFHQEEEQENTMSLQGSSKAEPSCKNGTSKGCGQGKGCSGGNGCGGDVSAKVELISDCRCIVCKKIGFHIQKQLERKAISAFDVTCTVEEALSKISNYFSHIDNHKSLRGQR
ncbi:MAG: hypothetical protein K2N51_04850 [Lachnospiraceae bacterium]|nr:hypothetical protein [Lachnospiraceae bacterium]